MTMKRDDGKIANNAAKDDSLETVDAVARAAHLWVRSLCLSEFQTDEERHAVASGLITGLCRHLELDARIQELVLYVYALLHDEGNEALAISRLMLNQPISRSTRHAYDKGRTEAAGIVEMLGYHDHYKTEPTQVSQKLTCPTRRRKCFSPGI
jgi:hypothetical protein